MKISVITVCKNAEETIEATIVSVLKQTYKNIEYIIIDGESSDRTLSVVQKYQHRIAHLISEVDNGVYHAMNKGIKYSSGDWIYFANADDSLYDIHVFNNLSRILSENRSTDLIYADHEALLSSGEREIFSKAKRDQVLDELITIGDQQPLQPATLFKSEVFKNIGLFNENYKIASDYEWFLRYFSDSRSHPYYYPYPIVCYQHGGLSSNIKMLFSEIFEIQSNSPICHSKESLYKRIKKLESMFVDKYDLLERTNDLSIKRLKTIDYLELEMSNCKKNQSQHLDRIHDLEAKLELTHNGSLTSLIRKFIHSFIHSFK